MKTVSKALPTKHPKSMNYKFNICFMFLKKLSTLQLKKVSLETDFISFQMVSLSASSSIKRYALKNEEEANLNTIPNIINGN